MTQTFQDIPLVAPATPLLDSLSGPADLRRLEQSQLRQVADELRAELLYTVGKTGGHFGAGLGVVELTVALHYVFDTPDDRLVWDVGHQTYPHKILTDRRDRMLTIRQEGGLSGFPKRTESKYDTFGVGHSSTSISAALGMAIGSRMAGHSRKTIAVIGDGAMTAGMAFEAINHTAHVDADLLTILNDNQMSISKNVGGLSTYFSKVWASNLYNMIREQGKKVLKTLPHASEFVKLTEEYLKGMVSPAPIFEELGLTYFGPIDGHDIDLLVDTLRQLKGMNKPLLLHIITQKGKGFGPAESDPIGYHALSKIAPKPAAKPVPAPPPKPKYQDVFGQWLCDMAAQDPKLVGITPAMCEGSGMVDFAQRFPDRFHDVAIAEQHAVTLAAGLACEGQKPVVAIYSTFLQRAYDQLIHDVALQNLDVTFGIDRAGLVGEDGATHAGSFDLSFLRCIPNMVIAAPSDENETRKLLYTAYQHPGPAAVRYPRGTGLGVEIEQTMQAVPIGKGVMRRRGEQVAILNFGTLLPRALEVAASLGATVADMRFVKPLDEHLVRELATTHSLIITLEENSLAGGAGSAVCEALNSMGIATPVRQFGLPDCFVDHASQERQLHSAGLDTETLLDTISTALSQLDSGQRLDGDFRRPSSAQLAP